MVRVSGVPYDVNLPGDGVDLQLPNKEDEPKLGLEAKAYYDGVRFGIEQAIAYLEIMDQVHKEFHNYYGFAARQLREKIK